MILLSFDTEEFDVPREHGVDFPLDEAMPFLCNTREGISTIGEYVIGIRKDCLAG